MLFNKKDVIDIKKTYVFSFNYYKSKLFLFFNRFEVIYNKFIFILILVKYIINKQKL